MLHAQKGFDVVDHVSLLRRLYFVGIHGADWLLLQNLYSDLKFFVKLEGTLSSPFVIKQGIQQGGVLSAAYHKRYNHPLLIKLEDKFTGAKIGCKTYPHPPYHCSKARWSYSDDSLPYRDASDVTHVWWLCHWSKKKTGPHSEVGNVSGNRWESDCKSRGREFDPGLVPYFRGD